MKNKLTPIPIESVKEPRKQNVVVLSLFTIPSSHLEPIIYNVGANPETMKESSNLRYPPGR